MSDHDNDDTAPDLTDPDLADFTASMEGEDAPDFTIEAVSLNRERMRAVKRLLAEGVEAAMPLNPLYIEVLAALGDVYLSVAAQCLAEQDIDMFQLTRDEVLRMIGIISAHINQIPMTVEHLAAAPVPEIRH